ncbi:UDP-2,4-diacetamido-2,4,6-trideoxy-beta-L-altropyranose hydrolase [Amphibacillus sp. Q70]|uniref:UDP-2,4-diacetamido-2,4, 6-trideoxy-beta-L-altropyranose hydrolase n=1 Tax=Amphibacillus sp. Q70 TaxID=3453416 RepID=UPI003F851AF0
MQIVFRVDVSIQIGSGHVQRCLTLADQLKQKGAQLSFVIKEQEGNMKSEIEQKGYPVYQIEPTHLTDERIDAKATLAVIEQFFDQVDLLIVDHFQLSSIWESVVKSSVYRLMVIDDLANREHNCDLLLDQNYYHGFQLRYRNLVPVYCRLLLGPKYLLLRPEFYQIIRKQREYDPIKKVLVFYGGSDPTNETEKVLKALDHCSLADTTIDVVIGSSHRQAEQIKQLCARIKATYHFNIDYMAELIAEADLAFGAGGISMWERCYLGLPSVVTIVADNQCQATIDAEREGWILNLGWHEDVTTDDYQKVLKSSLQTPDKLKTIENKLKPFFNHEIGASHPVVNEICTLLVKSEE